MSAPYDKEYKVIFGEGVRARSAGLEIALVAGLISVRIDIVGKIVIITLKKSQRSQRIRLQLCVNFVPGSFELLNSLMMTFFGMSTLNGL